MRFGRISFCSIIAGMMMDISCSNAFRKDIFLLLPSAVSKAFGCNFSNMETDCKPGYVSNGHLSRAAVAGSLKQPTRTDKSGQLSVLFGLASDGACHALCVTAKPVVSYTAVAPLPYSA